MKRYEDREDLDHPGAGAVDGIVGEKTRMALHKALDNHELRLTTIKKQATDAATAMRAWRPP